MTGQRVKSGVADTGEAGRQKTAEQALCLYQLTAG